MADTVFMTVLRDMSSRSDPDYYLRWVSPKVSVLGWAAVEMCASRRPASDWLQIGKVLIREASSCAWFGR